MAWIAGLAVVGVVATTGGAAWWAQRRVQAALADVVHLQQQVTALQTTLTGYTRYTSYLTAGKQTLAEQMKLLAATVVREEGATQIIEKSVLGLASTGVVAITYTAEYAFGFDLNPQSYELRATDTGIEMHIHRPTLVAAPAVTHLQHRIVSGGLLTDDKGAVIKLTGHKVDRFEGPAAVFDCEEDAFHAVQDGSVGEGDVIISSTISALCTLKYLPTPGYNASALVTSFIASSSGLRRMMW